MTVCAPSCRGGWSSRRRPILYPADGDVQMADADMAVLSGRRNENAEKRQNDLDLIETGVPHRFWLNAPIPHGH